MDVDETKLNGDEGAIYLFQWLASTEKVLRNGTLDVIKTIQPDLEKTLTKIIAAPEPYPSPGRPIRNLVARCCVVLYSRGETRTMFDTLQVLLKVTGEGKSGEREVNKVAAFYCIGELMGAFGSQVMSFMNEIATVTLKTARTSSLSILLRYQAMMALNKTLSTAARASADGTTKDILKFARSTLTDKSLALQRAAAEILITLHPLEDGNRTVSDVEYIIVQCTKSLEGADEETRQSLSRLVGHILASTQAIRAPPPVEQSKKKKGGDQEDPDTEGIHTVAAPAEPPKTIMMPAEMLSQLSAQFNKPNTTRKTKIGIFDFYAALFRVLGTSFVETHYGVVVKHFFKEIVNGSKLPQTRYERLLLRKLVGLIMRDLIGVGLLSEQGQIGAIRELSNTYLKKWPALMPGHMAPTSSVLVIALKEVTGLLEQLGNAPPPVQEALSEPLVTLLSHPSHSVRVSAAWALRGFCYSTPLRLPRIISNVMDMLQRDMASLATPAAPSDVHLRAVGHAYGLGALFALIPEKPLHVSHDISAKVLEMATQLLKGAADHEIHIANVEVEVAWTSIASLMSLGPNFVRSHLPQLLNLWRNALPKPTSNDSAAAGRSAAEWTFLLHVRESALGAILCFLRHNSPSLVTLDVARRISSLCSNALAFANAFVSQNTEDLNTNSGGMSVSAREYLLRRRTYQCFSALGFTSLPDTSQTTLLQSAMSLFASPDGYTGSAISAAIAASAGNFSSLWQVADGNGYGVTGIQLIQESGPGVLEDVAGGRRDPLNRDTIEASIDDAINQPVIGSCEHDPLLLCQAQTNHDHVWPEPPPSATAAVDAAIELFAALLPQQDLQSCKRIVTELTDLIKSPKFEKNPGRKAAVMINASTSLTMALRHSIAGHSKQAREIFGNSQISGPLAAFLKDALIDGDSVLRAIASEAIGRLASLSGTNFLSSQIKTLVDQVVNNRDPSCRAGCALAFGSIYTHVGGLAAGALLKTTVNVLMSLGNDPHPVVHFWALSALSQVVNAASLSYAPYVSSTLGMLSKLYMQESHEPEGGTLANTNIKGKLPVYQVICQLVDAVITVLGPDMQESARTRSLILDLVYEFAAEPDEGIRVEAIKCIQHFLLFAPEFISMTDLVVQLRTYLASPRTPLKLASINALYQLVQRDAFAMSKLGGDQLVEDLFSMLDGDPSIDGVRDVISSWLRQTAVYNPSAWIDLCQRIMSRSIASQQTAVGGGSAAAGAGADDEGASLSLSLGQDSAIDARATPTSRWRTQLFALQCLHNICTIVGRSGRREHIDIPFALKQGLTQSTLLISRAPDLIKMAFTASAAYVTEIRLEGLVVLQDVIEVFAKSPDPDFEDALFLEQHQAPITAALTPAFSADSTPEILAAAVRVCAVFVGCGVVKDVKKMGRILKLLTSALEQSKEAGMLTLGDSGELGPNASVMLRISTLSAWADLQVSSPEQTYLKDVIKPYKSLLASLWVAALRDYASIRADSEVLQESGPTSADSPYLGLGREVLLPYYVNAWPSVLQAVATAMKEQDGNILAAMDGQEDTVNGNMKVTPQPHREDPTIMFFALFGLAYEALCASSADSTSSPILRRNAVIALELLKSLVKPEYSGKAILDPPIFDEFIGLFYRMAITESAVVQKHLVEVLASFASSQKDRLLVGSQSDQAVTQSLGDIPITHCLRICGTVLRQAIPSLENTSTRDDMLADRIQLIRSAFSAFTTVSNAYGPGLKEETRAVAVTLYAELLKNEKSEVDLAGPTLQCLKELLEAPPQGVSSEALTRYSALLHGILSATLLNIEEMGGRQGAISTMKTKNNLLAAVLILTVTPSNIKLSRAAVERCCYFICQKLQHPNEQISITAAHCTKTLIVTGAGGNSILKQCIQYLMPGLVEYIAVVAAMSDNANAQEGSLNAMEEVLKALSTFFASVSEEYRPRVLGVFLPTFALLLDPSKTTPSSMHNQAVAHLVSFATTAPAAFKEATEKLEPATREKVELSVRNALAGQAAANRTAAKPQISLRSF